jgi:vitamin B12 transporter
MHSHGRSLATAALPLFATLCVTNAAAQQFAPPVVVSAARFEQSLDDTFPHTTLITRNDIERSQAPDVLTLLQRQAGIEIARLGDVGSFASILMRGGESRQVLVLLDGVPLNNVNFSLASLEHVVVGQVDRIEIVRGNVSSLYGSQAVGGVIQIFTRDGSGAPFSANARVVGGSRGTRDIQGGVGGQTGGQAAAWRYAASVSHFTTDGFNLLDQAKRPGTNPDRDGYDNRSAAARIAFTPAAGHEVGVRGHHARGRLQYDSEFGPATQPDESEQTLESASVYSRNRLGERWTSTLTYAKSRDALDARVTAFPFFVTSRGEQFTWQNDVTLTPGWTATAAAERLRQRIESDTTYARDRRTVDALRAGVVGRTGAHGVQLNLRHDDYSDFGEANTWYAGYRYAIAERWQLFASASTAFNAPTFNDLFFPFGGNPDLEPERTRSNEIGAAYAGQGLRARTALFRTRHRDLVGNDAAFNRVNIGRASNEGAEATLETFLWTVRVIASATFQDPRDDVADRRLVRRARAFGNLTLTRAFGAVGAELNWRATGDRADVFSGQPRRLGGYALVDLALRWRIHPQLAAVARVENAFDREHESAYGYRGTPRGFFAGIEARL